MVCVLCKSVFAFKQNLTTITPTADIATTSTADISTTTTSTADMPTGVAIEARSTNLAVSANVSEPLSSNSLLKPPHVREEQSLTKKQEVDQVYVVYFDQLQICQTSTFFTISMRDSRKAHTRT